MEVKIKMSKNKQYNNFYKSHAKEDKKNEEIKEVQAAEETVEVPQEETPSEEEKVEDISSDDRGPIRQFAIITGAKRVNMRKAPNKDADILRVLDENTEVELLGIHDRTWFEIGYQGETGYMMGMYLRPEN